MQLGKLAESIPPESLLSATVIDALHGTKSTTVQLEFGQFPTNVSNFDWIGLVKTLVSVAIPFFTSPFVIDVPTRNVPMEVASSTKTRGAGIGFAGVGIKLALLACTEVVTETRRGKHHVASTWRLASRQKAPWSLYVISSRRPSGSRK